MSENKTDVFNEEMANQYDARNSRLAPISDNLHFLTGLVLEDLPERAGLLVVGAGTGAEILKLARRFPAWTFTAVEPSRSMLNVCRNRIEDAGLTSRCEFFHGFVNDTPTEATYDAATALLVAHFVQDRRAQGRFGPAKTIISCAEDI